jgi:hypothetical protein
MPPLIFLAVIGAGCFAGFKLFTKLIEQAQTPSRSDRDRVRRDMRATAGTTRDLGELEWDEQAGVYKPRSNTTA